MKIIKIDKHLTGKKMERIWHLLHKNTIVPVPYGDELLVLIDFGTALASVILHGKHRALLPHHILHELLAISLRWNSPLFQVLTFLFLYIVSPCVQASLYISKMGSENVWYNMKIFCINILIRVYLFSSHCNFISCTSLKDNTTKYAWDRSA